MCLQKARSTTMKSTITFLVNASFSRQCPKTWRRRAMIFVFTDCWEVIFWRKNVEKRLFFIFIDPYRTRPGTGKTCSLHVPPPVEITPKTSANFASLNSSIARGALRSRRCLRARCSQAPAESQFIIYRFIDLHNLRDKSQAGMRLWHRARERGNKYCERREFQ